MREGSPRVLTAQTLASERRSMLPFLPTLATALVVAAASLLCHPPALLDPRPDSPVQPARAGADGFHFVPRSATPDRTPALAAAEIVPAVLAFGRLPPPAFVAERAVKPAGASGRAGRPTTQAILASAAAALAARRPCSGMSASTPASRCAEPRRGEPVHVSAVVPPRPAPETVVDPTASASNAAQPFPVTPEQEQDEDLLPADALPYASTATSWLDGVGRFGVNLGGREAVAVGGSVAELLAGAR